MVLEKQLKYRVGEQMLFPFAEEIRKEERRRKWGSVPEWITAISLPTGLAIVTYDIYLRDPVNNFIEHVMQYSPK